MTCIVGYLDKKSDKVIIGGDSAGVAGFELSIRKDPKVFKNEDFIIGCTSSFRMIQLLRFSFKPPKVHDKDIYEYMCTDFIDAVRSCFKNGGFLEKERESEVGGFFLVAYKNRLFQIQGDFQVSEQLNGMDSCGCGSAYALGSLRCLAEFSLDPTEIVRKSLESAEFFSAGVSRPFIILST